LFKAGINYQLPAERFNVTCLGEILNFRSKNAIPHGEVSSFRAENWDEPSRIWELSLRQSYFNTGRNQYLPAGRLNTLYLGEIHNLRSENDAIFCEKISTSGRRIHGLPTSGRRI